MLKKEKTLKCDNCVKNRERERRKSIKLRNHDLLFVDLNKNCFSIMRKILVEREMEREGEESECLLTNQF